MKPLRLEHQLARLVTLDLPRPPSINELWRYERGRIHLSSTYERWMSAADRASIQKKPITIQDKWTAEILILRTPRFDLDNLATKALFDWLKSREYVRSDHDCEGYMVSWGDAPGGCRVTIRPLEE